MSTTAPDEQVAVHALIPSDMWWRLKAVSKERRRPQAELCREALDGLFRKYDRTQNFAFDLGDVSLITSLVVRIDKRRYERLKALVTRTRIRQSEFVREALADYLREAA